MTTVVTQPDALVAVALPLSEASTGLVWRLARRVDSRVVRQVSEAEVDGTVVVPFEAVGTGAASVVFALTRGESSPAAVRTVTHKLQVT